MPKTEPFRSKIDVSQLEGAVGHLRRDYATESPIQDLHDSKPDLLCSSNAHNFAAYICHRREQLYHHRRLRSPAITPVRQSTFLDDRLVGMHRLARAVSDSGYVLR